MLVSQLAVSWFNQVQQPNSSTVGPTQFKAWLNQVTGTSFTGAMTTERSPSTKRTHLSASCLVGAVRLPAEGICLTPMVDYAPFFRSSVTRGPMTGGDRGPLRCVDSSTPKLSLALRFFVVGLSGPPFLCLSGLPLTPSQPYSR